MPWWLNNKNSVNNFLQINIFIQRNIWIKIPQWCFENVTTSFHCITLCDRKNPSLHVCTFCMGMPAFKMITELICLQEELAIVLITTLDLQTFIKGHHVNKDIWTPKQVEQSNGLMEPDNRMDKFAVCVMINETNMVRENEYSTYPRFCELLEVNCICFWTILSNSFFNFE